MDTLDFLPPKKPVEGSPADKRARTNKSDQHRHEQGGDAYRFGIDLGRKYGVGDKEKRTGLVVVLSTEDRTYQILTGYGLEGTLPDAICRRVENRVMVPLLKQGKWDAAMLSTMRALDTYIRRDGSLRPGATEKADDRSAWMALPVALVVLIILIGVFSLANHKKTRRCPRCHRSRHNTRQTYYMGLTSTKKVHYLNNHY